MKKRWTTTTRRLIVVVALLLLCAVPVSAVCYDNLAADASTLWTKMQDYFSESDVWSCDAGAIGWTPQYTQLSDWSCVSMMAPWNYQWSFSYNGATATVNYVTTTINAPACETLYPAQGCVQFELDLHSLRTAQQTYYAEQATYSCFPAALGWTPINTSSDSWECGHADNVGWGWNYTSAADERVDVVESTDYDCNLYGAPNASLFTGSRTNVNNYIFPQNARNVSVEMPSKGAIRWPGIINISKLDFNSNVRIDNNFVDVNESNLNTAAQITLYNLSWQAVPIIYKNGNACATCRFVSYGGGTIIFNVTGFSNYTTGPNTGLAIWDDTDAEGGSQTRHMWDTVGFFGNYSNITDGTPITNALGQCNISFVAAPQGPFAMSYNSTTLLWTYSRSFSSTGSPYWNVSCGSTRFEPLATSDYVYIQELVINNSFEFGSLETLVALGLVAAGIINLRRHR